MSRIFQIVALILIAPISWAQSITGTFLGTITDSSGSAIANVSVQIVNNSTNLIRTALTNDSGNYSIVDVPAGTSRMEFRRSGVKKAVRNEVILQIGEQLRSNESLIVDIAPTTQQVESNSPVSQIDTDSAAIRGVISAYEIRNLPLNGRLFESLVQLFPGVVLPVQGSHLSARGGFNVAGFDEHYNSFLMDGIDNVDPIIRNFSFRPSVDTVQEFQILERGYNAQFGRNAGAVINVITKSGSN